MQYVHWETIVSWRRALWHWRLNPGLAFNELILGQAIPRDTYVRSNSKAVEWHWGRSKVTKNDSGAYLRTYVRCCQCNQIRTSLRWSGSRAFGNWFGMYCDCCGAEYPRIHNWLAMAVRCVALPATIPVWWFIGPYYRKWNRGRIVLKKHA